MNPNQELHEAGQSIWLDSITREMVEGGKLERYIEELAVTGLTSNPTIFDKAIRAGSDYDGQVGELLASGVDGEELFFELAITDLRGAADLFAPIHDRTEGRDGWVSLEVSPLLAYDAASTIEAARSLHERAERPNLFIKIPGTEQGAEAIEETIAAGVPVNVTLLFSAEHYERQADAYMRGLEQRIERGFDAAVASVASIFVSRWDVAVADRVAPELRNRLGVAVAAQAYGAYRALLESERWLALAERGARPQRLLFASTGVKDPELDPTTYVRELAAPETINTMPEDTLLAFAEHGEVGELLSSGAGEPGAALGEFVEAGIDLGALAAQLQEEGAEKFDESWRDLLACIERKSEQVGAGG